MGLILAGENPLVKQTATCSSVLAWSIPWTEEDGKIQSVVLRRAGHDLATKPETMLHRHVPTSSK